MQAWIEAWFRDDRAVADATRSCDRSLWRKLLVDARWAMTQRQEQPGALAAAFGWLQRWNFIERARLERELWDAFERGEPIEQLVEQCEPGFRREVWSVTAGRIRKIEQMMRDQTPRG